jgi:hypothetical protein
LDTGVLPKDWRDANISSWLLWSVGFHKNIRTWNHGLNLLVSYFSPGVLGDVCR